MSSKNSVDVCNEAHASLSKLLPEVAAVLCGRYVQSASGWRLTFDFGPPHMVAAATVTIDLRPRYDVDGAARSTRISSPSLPSMHGEPSVQTIAGIAHTHGAAIVAASQFAEIAEAIVRHEVARQTGGV